MSVHEEEVRLPEVEERQPWIYTYGDLLTLLLCFFIILSSSNASQKEQVKSGVSYGLRGGPPASPYFFSGNKDLLTTNSTNNAAMVANLIVGADVLVDDRGILVSLNEQLAFRSGDAKMTDEALTILREFAFLIENLPNSIVVEGHTDDIPIASSLYPSNWSLSSARAASVAEALERFGVSPQRMEVVGYGSTRPKVRNLDNASRAINRRVDILIRPDDGPPQLIP